MSDSHTLNTQSDIEYQKFKAIVEGSDNAIISKDLTGTILSWNPAAERIFGYSASEIVGQKIFRLIPEDRMIEEDAILEQIARGEKVAHFRTKRLHKSGRLIDISVTVSPVFSADGVVIGASKIARDITLEQKAKQDIARYKSLIENSDDAIISKTLEGIIQTWNPAAEKMFGYSAQEIIGKPITTIFPPDRYSEEERILKTVSSGEIIHHFRTTRIRKDGSSVFVSASISPITDDNGVIVGVSKIVRDISTEIANEEQIWKLANYDALTGLCNINGFTKYAESLIQLSTLRNRRFALLYFDIDHFKIYNDTYGHAFGDEVLKVLGKRIKRSLTESDELARFSSDVFVISLANYEDAQALKTRIEAIQEQLKQPFDVNDTRISLSSSIGVATFPEDDTSLSGLLQKADHALHMAKMKGKAQYRLFSSFEAKERTENYAMVQELSLAIEREQLEVYYQPIIDAQTLRICKAEALIRWKHPEFGFVAPDVFIPLAEKYGIIQQIGNWITEQALATLKDWTALFGLTFKMSINKSPFEFYDHDRSIIDIKKALHKHGLKGSNLIMEITETTLMEHSAVTSKILNSYHEIGINLAIDDFGTGYSSLSYLRHYPFNILKIDRSFVATMEVNSPDYHLCKGMIQIASDLGLEVVAEGVETDAQVALLESLGCQNYQGYYFSKPLPRIEFEALANKLMNQPFLYK